jgi:hypothetical protein
MDNEETNLLSTQKIDAEAKFDQANNPEFGLMREYSKQLNGEIEDQTEKNDRDN